MDHYAFPNGITTPEVSSAPPPRTTFETTDPYGRGIPRPRRTSGASSFAESISSSHASSSHSSAVRSSPRSKHTSMSEGGSANPRLHPGGNNEGFLVDVPGAGVYEVQWSELVGLLVSSESSCR